MLDLRAAAGVTVLAMGLLLTSGGIGARVTGGDLDGLHVAKYQEATRALLEGRLPLWNPWEFCGNALLGSGQGGVLYPPAWVLFGTLPTWSAVQAFYAVHILILAWGTVAYLGHHAIGRLAASLAVLITLAGLFTGAAAAGIDHPSFLANLAWLPVLLLCWQHAVERGAAPWLGWFGLAAGAQWLAAYPDFPMDTAVLLGIVAVVSSGGSLRRRVGLLVAGAVLGVMIGAPQILPLAETIRESPRGQEQWYFDVMRSAFAVQSPSWLARWLDMRHGVAALLLVVVALVRPQRDRIAWAAALVWALFALTPPFDLLYRLPPFSGARNPTGWGHLFPFFVGALAAAGVTTAAGMSRRAFVVAGWVLVSLAGVHAGRILVMAPRALPLRPPDLAEQAQRAGILQGLMAAHPDAPRIVTGPESEGGVLRYRLRSATGYDPSLPPARIVRLLRVLSLKEGAWPQPQVQAAMAAHPDLAALLGIGLAVVPSGPSPLGQVGFARVGVVPPDDVVLLRAAVPRARLVHRIVAATGDDDAFERTVAPGRDVHATAVVAASDVPSLVEPMPGATERVRIAEDDPEKVVVEATLAADGVLVLTDTYYPGWSVTVDGVPAPILRADYAFRGVALRAGSHRVAFRYAPRSVHAGFVLAGLGLIVVLLLVTRRSGTVA